MNSRPDAESLQRSGSARRQRSKAVPIPTPEGRDDDRVIFAFAHLRKCAGTSVRSILLAPGSGWYAFSYCKTLAEYAWSWEQTLERAAVVLNGTSRRPAPGAPRHARRGPPLGIPPLVAHRKWFLEVHCNPSLRLFTYGARRVRAVAAAAGYRLVTAILLREPVDLLVSDFSYFVHAPERRNISFLEFARNKPEYLLLGSGHGYGYRQLNLCPDFVHLASLRAPRNDAVQRAMSELVRGERARAFAAEQRQQARELTGASADAADVSEVRYVQALHWAQNARGRLVRALMREGSLACEDLVVNASSHLREVDVVGVVRRFDDFVAVLIHRLGLEVLPRFYSANTREAHTVALASHVGAGHGVAPPAEEVARHQAELRSLNACSRQVYDRWAGHFDRHISEERLHRPRDFGAHLAAARAASRRSSNRTRARIQAALSLRAAGAAGPLQSP